MNIFNSLYGVCSGGIVVVVVFACSTLLLSPVALSMSLVALSL